MTDPISFEETLLIKLNRLESWATRIQKEITSLSQDLVIVRGRIAEKNSPALKKNQSKKIEQLTMFGT